MLKDSTTFIRIEIDSKVDDVNFGVKKQNCHTFLLDEDDEFLTALLKPIADVNDNLKEEEIEKLPINLQYYEGHRCQDTLITDSIVDSLYQLQTLIRNYVSETLFGYHDT
ncbi:unnamed protein product [Thelazia callipaeda]|uniref:DUF3456 domain-containing protein n=1 Tax=Thelazia callipaeda TaxID=103827 RepID=A0A0N5CZV7_THECL|nr:unnamed protein product [Thelazia callipaeda]